VLSYAVLSITCFPVLHCRVLCCQGGREAVPQWVELANGCLCCSVKAEFVQALEALLAADGGHEGKFDYVLVETTGEAGSWAWSACWTCGLLGKVWVHSLSAVQCRRLVHHHVAVMWCGLLLVTDEQLGG
jgi:hypothetical protein